MPSSIFLGPGSTRRRGERIKTVKNEDLQTNRRSRKVFLVPHLSHPWPSLTAWRSPHFMWHGPHPNRLSTGLTSEACCEGAGRSRDSRILSNRCPGPKDRPFTSHISTMTSYLDIVGTTATSLRLDYSLLKICERYRQCKASTRSCSSSAGTRYLGPTHDPRGK